MSYHATGISPAGGECNRGGDAHPGVGCDRHPRGNGSSRADGYAAHAVYPCYSDDHGRGDGRGYRISRAVFYARAHADRRIPRALLYLYTSAGGRCTFRRPIR
jgi:hypothetical protein